MKQTHTKQVEEVMEGCGETFKRKSYGDYSGYKITEVKCGIIFLCPSCKSVLKGMQTAIQNELDFLLPNKNFQLDITKCKYCGKNLSKFARRITDCKNASAKIKEVLQ